MTREEKDRRNQLARARYKADPSKKRRAHKYYYLRVRTKRLEQMRDYNYNRVYKISAVDRDAKFEKQQRKCAVCRTDAPGSKNGWHLDHCHTTGIIRGILCHHCNLALGHAKDNPILLRQLADYIDSFSALHSTPNLPAYTA